jgi:hypothetical protein
LAGALGAVLAELLVVQRPLGPRVADVRGRQWRDYIAGGWLTVAVVCVVVATGSWAVAVTRHVLQWQWAWVGPVAGLIALLALTTGVHHVVSRPALAVHGRDRLLDDALRADGIHHIVGAAVALAGFGACLSWGLAADGSWWSLLAVVGEGGALGTWNMLARNEPWNVALARQARA